MRIARILLKLSQLSIERSFQNPLAASFFIMGKLLRFGLFFYFVSTLVTHTKLLAGYTVDQTVLFFLTFTIIDTLSQLLFRAVYSFRPLLVSGEFDHILTKPFHPFVVVLFGAIDILDAIVLVLYMGITGFIMAQTTGIAALHLGLYAAFIVNSLLIAMAFHIAILAMGIITIEVDHTAMIYRDMSRLGSFPIEIYKEPLRSIVTFIIPIGIMMSVPAQALLGILPTQALIVYGVFAVFFVGLSLGFWRYALQYYQSWGS